MGAEYESVLAREVFAGDAYKPFGELSVADVEALAAELRESVGWGPMMRVRPVAMAWQELAQLMGSEGAARVADLDPTVAASYAERVWVTPPSDTVLGSDPS